MRVTWSIAAGLVVLCTAGRAGAQINFCQNNAAVVSEGAEIAVPAGHTQLSLTTPTGAATGTFTRTVSGKWTPTAADVTEIGAAQTGAGTSIFLHWSGPAGTTSCDQSIVLTTGSGGGGVGGGGVGGQPPVRLAAGGEAETKTWNAGECARAGAQWGQELQQKTGGNRFTEVVFLENHDVCFRNRDYGVTGDPIYVGVFTSHAEAWDTATISFDPCSLEPASPNVLISDKSSVLSGFQSGGWKLITYPERSCFNSSVAVTLKADIGNTTVTARTTVDQATRYRATLNLGTLFTNLHDRSFGLRSDGTNSRIFGKGPDNRGPEYYAAVVLYALPRYIPTLFGQGHYAGRDVVHDNTLIDRLGGVVGVGIKDPRKQFVVGFALEAIPGVSLTGTWNYARVTRLAEVKEGDIFTGTAETLPTRQVWDHEFAWGLSLDLRYVSALVTR